MEEKSKRRQVLIKICCVIASFILWLYIFNVENPIRERSIVVPVQVVNRDVLAQSKLVPIGEEELNISLVIRGNASEVYSIKPSDFKLQSDLSAYVMKKGENKIPVEVKKSPDNIRIVNSENLWIKIILEDLKRKTVPIKISLDGKAREGFYAVQPILKAKEAEINGPEDVVNTVNNVIAKYNVKDASKDINATLSLEAQDASGNAIKNIQINPDSIQVTIPIRKIKSVPINVKTEGKLVNGGNVKSIVPTPDKIDISGEESDIANINSLDIEPIDLSKIEGKDTIESKIIVPKGVNLVNSNGIVKLKVSADKAAQKEFNIGIQIRNLENNYTAQLSTDKVTISLSGTENVINNLKEENIQCFVDLTSLNEGENAVIVNVILPEGVSKVSQNPQNIKVTLKKKVLEGKNVN